MIEISLVFFSGILIFLFTGLDDLMVVYTLIHGQPKRQRIPVYLGTFFGVLLMFSLVLVADHLLKSYIFHSIENIRNYLRFLLIFPIGYAMVILYRNLFGGKQTDKTQDSPISGNQYFWLACVIYLSNMADDLTFNLTFLLNIEHKFNYAYLFLGNLAGCLIMFSIADHLAQKLSTSRYKKIILNAIAVGIILLCLRTILL